MFIENFKLTPYSSIYAEKPSLYAVFISKTIFKFVSIVFLTLRLKLSLKRKNFLNYQILKMHHFSSF